MIDHFLSRRAVVASAALGAMGTRCVRGQERGPSFSYPIGQPGRILGDGFFIRHGYATENTWYNPGWLHCGEDWYAIEGDTADATIYAVAAGEVVFAGSDYPGLVVMVRHAPDLYSMYGHLVYDVPVEPGQRVERGDVLGTVLARSDGRAPSHLHFETRTFLTHPEVNGEAARYAVGCGYLCPPGPGYWPAGAPEHPSDLGWRNPTHLINADGYADLDLPQEAEVVVAADDQELIVPRARNAPGAAPAVSSAELAPGTVLPLLAIASGSPASEGSSAESYSVHYQVRLPNGDEPWVEATLATMEETGSDGRPSAIRFKLLPAVRAR